MRKVISILLLFALTAQCFNQLRIITYYQLNKAYIAKVLCINRDKPSLHCDGKCYLKRQLQNDSDQEKNVASNLRELSETVIFCEPVYTFRPATVGLTGKYSGYFNRALLSPCAAPVFHPPCA